MSGKTNVVLTGVGGQGVITAANILGKAAVNANVHVYVSEVHGMAQRGGSVICMVRMGNISGSLVASGTADAIVSTEPVEALRYIRYANKKTKIITDINPVIPSTIAIGGEKYPDLKDVFKEIKTHAELYKIDALKIAKESGDIITKNIVMLGTLAATSILPFNSDVFLKTILDSVPSKYKGINEKAFRGGVQAFKKH